MSAPRQYPDVFHKHRWTVLPEPVQRAVYELGCASRRDRVEPAQIDTYRQGLANLTPAAVPRGGYEIRRLYKPDEPWVRPVDEIPNQAPPWYRIGPGGGGSGERHRLTRYPDLGWLFLFHGDGYLRQAALEALPGSPRSPFEFAAICYRLNDWVENVRLAAEAYAARAFPETDPNVIAGAAFFLLEMEPHLQRWSDRGQGLMRHALARPDVAASLAQILETALTGRQGFLLQQLLRDPPLDASLHRLAHHAALPGVRRVAMTALLTGEARWLTGHRFEWTDKTMGLRKLVPTHDTRSLTVARDLPALLSAAARDRSPKVREVAADGLIAHREKATSHMDALAARLAEDTSPSVRSRAAYYLTHR
uniref:HEAT repeat domain-containing protein n=1 Tax=Roseovarius indicus TaxID=540747 RepID=UPI003B51EE09